MATFTNWNWSGDNKHQVLSACSDTNPHEGTTWSMIAEVRKDSNGFCWSFVYYPDFDVVVSASTDEMFWIGMPMAELAAETYLREQGVI